MRGTVFYQSIRNIAPPTLWQPWTWRGFEASQQPEWLERDLAPITDKIASLPPLISAQEIDFLKEMIADAGAGKRFVLQAGDCAERFQDCSEQHISGRLKILLQMGLVIAYQIRKPVVRIGRMAGQYAKPRSELFECASDGETVPSFRGDNINSFLMSKEGRLPDPNRLLMSYHHSGATLNFMRTLIAAGFTDLKHLAHWDLQTKRPSKSFAGARYAKITKALLDARAFFDSDRVASDPEAGQRSNLRSNLSASENKFDFFVSHEALVLPYEEAMTRYVPQAGRWYNMGAHMLWIGDRTRQLDGAHVEYCRGIGNPIGIKIGADSDPTDIIALVKKLNPHNEAGKITLITRYGAQNVEGKLPRLLLALRESNLTLTWACDPMHGNTERTELGVKTRSFDKILTELQQTVLAHRISGTHFGGVHLELTHESVTECLGGSEFISEGDLPQRYETWCDPRLNDTQSLEVAFAISEILQNC